jgi:integrase
MRQFFNMIVFIAGMPRSGSTFSFNMARPKVLERTIWYGCRQSHWPFRPGTQRASFSRLRVTTVPGMGKSWFLHFQGEIEVDLSQALPNVANWALSNLPKYISAGAVQRAWDQCDRQTAVGRRNYAVLLLLARLGMRAGDVLHLNLGDIDWHNARIIIRVRKGPSWTQLPPNR